MKPASARVAPVLREPQQQTDSQSQISREKIPPPAADHHPQFAASCLQSAAHSESFQKAMEIVQEEATPKIYAEMESTFIFQGVSTYKGKPFVYKNKDDPFHQNIGTFIRNLVCFKVI